MRSLLLFFLGVPIPVIILITPARSVPIAGSLLSSKHYA